MLELAIGALILLGVAGTIIPFLPGPILVGTGLLIYALVEQTTAAWVTLAIGFAILALGFALKWLVPARKVAGNVDKWALFTGSALAIVGFFVLPVVGLVIGFVVGVFGFEVAKRRSFTDAWPATKHALTAAGLSMLIELASVVVTGCLWLAAVVLY